MLMINYNFKTIKAGSILHANTKSTILCEPTVGKVLAEFVIRLGPN